MNERTRQIEQLLERGVSTREISRAVDVSREWVIHIRHRYEAKKYKRLYQALVERLGQEELWNDSELIQP